MPLFEREFMDRRKRSDTTLKAGEAHTGCDKEIKEFLRETLKNIESHLGEDAVSVDVVLIARVQTAKSNRPLVCCRVGPDRICAMASMLEKVAESFWSAGVIHHGHALAGRIRQPGGKGRAMPLFEREFMDRRKRSDTTLKASARRKRHWKRRQRRRVAEFLAKSDRQKAQNRDD